MKHTLVTLLIIVLTAFTTKAQTYTSASTSDIVLATVPNVKTLNCDMFKCHNVGGYLYAVAYDSSGYVKMKVWHSSGIGGIITTTAVSNTASFPDIAIADDTVYLGTRYTICFTFTRSGQVNVQRYSVQNVGQTNFGVGDRPPVAVSRTGYDAKNSHIDLIADTIHKVAGKPTYHKFVVTWNENDNTIWAATGTTRFPATYTSFMVDSLTGCANPFPDVATAMDITTNTPYAYIVYNTSSGIKLASANISSTTPAFTKSTLSSYVLPDALVPYFSPRIEAMNIFDPSVTTARYQVVTSEFNPTSFEYDINSYNDLVTGADNCTDLINGYNHHFPVVAAGVGQTGYAGVSTSAVGNNYYTLGWKTNGSNNLSQYVEATSGGRKLPTSTYFNINAGTAGSAGLPIALSSTTNTGDNILSVWYDGTNIMYKITSNSSGYKPLINNNAEPLQSFEIYPNPASDILHVKGDGQLKYLITDITGRSLQEGDIQDEIVDIKNLAAGCYIINITNDREYKQSIKFIKK